MKSVSIITVTQFKRRECLEITVDLIKYQTYKNIIEWVIVEGSKTLEESINNEKIIKKINLDIPIVYIPAYSDNLTFNNHHLGELRNIGNKTCRGDITVCMDDDDYYPPTRVEHCVNALNNTKYLIAGCSQKYLYDYCLDKLVYFKEFGPNHSTNDCMAWKKEYLLENKHDSSVDMAEESSFTKNFTNPMVQLDKHHVIIGSSHYDNTFSKKELIINSYLYRNPNNPSEGYIYPMSIQSLDHPQKLMGGFYKRYSLIFKKKEVSEFDIVYFCGGTCVEWDPVSESLGGSEQAVVNLSSEWVLSGKKVAVYSKLIKETIYRGVHYIDWKRFAFNKFYKNIILWRLSGINCGLQFNLKAEKIFLDFHDSSNIFRFPYKNYLYKVDKLFFKSDFHLEIYEKDFKTKVNKQNYAIIPNGIRVDKFIKAPSNIKRDPFRFCFCSCYTRGLFEILKYIWPIIFKEFPQAELHLYYGMYGIDKNFQYNLTLLMGQPGVMDHGRRPVDEIVIEKWRSTFQLYISSCDGETDCISIRESLVSGCIPLISKHGVFKNRDGLHFDLEETPEGYEKIAKRIIKLLNKPDFIEMSRNKFSKSPTIMDWGFVSREWEKHFYNGGS